MTVLLNFVNRRTERHLHPKEKKDKTNREEYKQTNKIECGAGCYRKTKCS